MSRYCAGHFVYPDPFTDENHFIDCLKEWVARLQPTMLLPTHDESVVIMRHREEFPKDLIIPYEDEKTLLLLANKATSTALAGNSRVPIPKVYHSEEEINQYPVVFKTVIGNSAKSVFFPKNREELHRLLKRIVVQIR